MDDALRVALWNAVDLVYWQPYVESSDPYRQKDLDFVLYQVWSTLFKKPTDTKPDNLSVAWRYLREWFLQEAAWEEVYDFIELLPSWYHDSSGAGTNGTFREICNAILKREMSGFRFIGAQLARITSEQEVDEIEQALAASTGSAHSIHLSTALRLLSDREQPDYRNSIKESVSAVEAVVRKLSGSSKQGVADALLSLERAGALPTAIKNAMTSLYGYASSPQSGARHSLGETAAEVGFAEAKFSLVVCSAFINYMLERSASGADAGKSS